MGSAGVGLEPESDEPPVLSRFLLSEIVERVRSAPKLSEGVKVKH